MVTLDTALAGLILCLEGAFERVDSVSWEMFVREPMLCRRMCLQESWYCIWEAVCQILTASWRDVVFEWMLTVSYCTTVADTTMIAQTTSAVQVLRLPPPPSPKALRSPLGTSTPSHIQALAKTSALLRS